jgi:hypothetical protein
MICALALADMPLHGAVAEPLLSLNELVIACDDGVRTVRRTTQQRIRNITANRPRRVSVDA